jgi:hypothetical protein
MRRGLRIFANEGDSKVYWALNIDELSHMEMKFTEVVGVDMSARELHDATQGGVRAQSAAIAPITAAVPPNGETASKVSRPRAERGSWAAATRPPKDQGWHGPVTGPITWLAKELKIAYKTLKRRHGKTIWVQYIDGTQFDLWTNVESEYRKIWLAKRPERKSRRDTTPKS